MNIHLNLVLSLVSIITFLAIIAGLTFLIFRLFEDSSNTGDDRDKQIKRKWLLAFSMLATCASIAVSLQLYAAAVAGLDAEQIGEKIGSALFVFTIYLGLVYYFGYFKRGTKYILGITIIQILNYLAVLPQFFKFLFFSIFSLSFCLNCNMPYQTIYMSSLAAFMLVTLASAIYYVVNNIRLFKANRRYKRTFNNGSIETVPSHDEKAA